MNFKLTHISKPALLDLMAEKLLEKGFSVSYKEMQGIEFLSACFQHNAEDNKIFLAFDPVETNAAVFLALLSLLKDGAEKNILVIVPAEGEREILLNILKIQEIHLTEVLSLSEFAFYPLQLVK